MDTTMLKDLTSPLGNPITKVTNISISQEKFPGAWMSAVVTPIFKSGDSHSCLCYKAFEGLLLQLLTLVGVLKACIVPLPKDLDWHL